MEIKITGTPKEIADLVLGIQSQQTDELINVANKKKPTKNQFSGFGNSLMRLKLPTSKEEVCSFLVKEMNRVTEKELAESFVDFIVDKENSTINIRFKFDC